MKRRLPDIITVSLFIGFLALGFVKTAFFSKPVNEYENRPANKLPDFSASAFSDGSFQDGVENALSDQIPFGESFKKAYNGINSAYLKAVTDPLREASRNKYMELMGMQLYDGEYFCLRSYSLDDYKSQLDSRLENINKTVSAHPDTDFYGYYIEKDIDIDLTTGERFGAYDYLKQNIAIENFEKFSVDSAETYKKYFYKTDHHWNKDGSYKAYTELLSLLNVTDVPLTPAGTRVLTDEFSGAYAKGKGISGFSELLEVNIFDYQPKEIYINGEKTEKYGGSDTDFTYGGWYGADKGEVIFKNNNPEKENILILGDSYDNAVLSLLSSHFDTLCAVDLRYIREFELSSYLDKHNIDKVLFIGCANLYFEDGFDVEDKNI